jgi:hypothetical protein
MYRDQTQATVERLRLVCRLWAQILQRRTREYALTDHDGHYYPSEQMARQTVRLGLSSPVPSPRCIQGGSECRYHTKKREETSLNGKSDTEEYVRSFHVLFPTVRILNLDDSHISPPSSLGTLNNLRGLSIYLGSHKYFSLRDLSLCVPHLTHLRLRPETVHERPLFEPFSHACLQYLTINVFARRNAQERTFALGTTWNFPKLKTLLVSGPVNEAFEASIHDFLLRHANQLTELSLTYTKFSNADFGGPAIITEPIWRDCLATLKIFGLSTQHVFPENRMSLRWLTHERTLSTVVVSDLVYFKGNHPSRIIEGLMDMQQSWKVNVFVFPDSWLLTAEILDCSWCDVVKYGLCAKDFLISLAEKLRNVRLEDDMGVTLNEFLQTRYQYGSSGSDS